MDDGRRTVRPRGVTLLSLVLFAAAVGNALRFGKAVSAFSRLASLDLSVPPWYFPLTGAVWAAVGLAIAAGLWALQPWARRGALVASALYAVHYWADRLLLAVSPYSRQALPFDALVTAAALAFVWITLNRPPVRRAFRSGELDDARPQD